MEPSTSRAPSVRQLTAITGARVFDGERIIDAPVVVIDGSRISSVGREVPPGAAIVDARGATLLPGLIDAHTHTSPQDLAAALPFGVTTELEMGNPGSAAVRAAVAGRDDVADYFTAGVSITARGGHPAQLFPQPPTHDFCQCGTLSPQPANPADAADVVGQLVSGGSDYIKIIVEDGTVFGTPGLPVLTDDTITAAVHAAHKHDRLAIAHALTRASTERAVAAGVDGLAHLFIDGPHTSALIDVVAASGAFVVPCMVVNATLMGRTPTDFANDERVASRLSAEWLENLRTSVGRYPQGDFTAALASVGALYAAGVDVLVGTDVSRPGAATGGAAHGASVHQELQFLVQAGLAPAQALAAATSVAARRFGLQDRGRVAPGARADLLLVEGDPTTTITDSLNIRSVWRRGTRLAV